MNFTSQLEPKICDVNLNRIPHQKVRDLQLERAVSLVQGLAAKHMLMMLVHVKHSLSEAWLRASLAEGTQRG